MATQLLYLTDMCALTANAHVIEIIQQELSSEYTLILDQTIFYPQGGGQPSDKGAIKNAQGNFHVKDVSKHNDKVHHRGFFQQGSFALDAFVELHIDSELRNLHNRNHTAGHLIDYALAQLGYALMPKKAYHFPQGPYVEYAATLEQPEREQLKINLEKTVNELVQQSLPVRIDFLDNDPHKRVMIVADYLPILCGGTHVINTHDIGPMTIRKIKNEKGALRVSYAC